MDKEYSKLSDYITLNMPHEMGKGGRRGESFSDIAIRLLEEYKELKCNEAAQETIEELEKRRDDLTKEIDALSNEIADIKSQIIKAIENYKANGEYADPKWFGSAKLAAHFRVVKLAKLQRELKNLNTQLKKARAMTYERYFINAAKELLSESQ